MLSDIWAKDTRSRREKKTGMSSCVVAVLDICQMAVNGRAIVMCWGAGEEIIKHRSMSITLRCIKPYALPHESIFCHSQSFHFTVGWPHIHFNQPFGWPSWQLLTTEADKGDDKSYHYWYKLWVCFWGHLPVLDFSRYSWGYSRKQDYGFLSSRSNFFAGWMWRDWTTSCIFSCMKIVYEKSYVILVLCKNAVIFFNPIVLSWNCFFWAENLVVFSNFFCRSLQANKKRNTLLCWGSLFLLVFCFVC